ncbi:MAG: aconitate hydratase AcnA [Alphaproteobacteria bacterium]|nr:aconitate hydratase AcnA [Alphaproteobacteria bacterium]
MSNDTLQTKRSSTIDNKEYDYFSIKAAEEKIGNVSRLPYSLKVLLENMLRFEDGKSVTTKDVQAIADWQKKQTSTHEIAFRPARVIMQDLTGVPAVVDLAAMRDGMKQLGGDPQKINPLVPVDLIIDHSVWVDEFGRKDALTQNMKNEFARNQERYKFLKWGQNAFDNFRIVPPGSGIIHQINLEHLAKIVWTGDTDQNGKQTIYPDTVVGTDSHTVMINGAGVLGWGVGGIEAEAGMLGQPISMKIPDVVGVNLTGKITEGVTSTDIVLNIVNLLRDQNIVGKEGVVGKFVEFHGTGVDNLTLADRATIANMAPEYGATMGFFPIDEKTIDYMRFTGRDKHQITLTKAYAKEQGLWRETNSPTPVFSQSIDFDMSSVEPTIAGPKHPKETYHLKDAASEFDKVYKYNAPNAHNINKLRSVDVAGQDFKLTDGDIVIAAINSCTNTSNPSALIAAGLLAQKAVEKGLTRKPWVKTSLTPGSLVVADYLEKSGLQKYLDALQFNIAGFGCATCIGNSGEKIDGITDAITENELVATTISSGNRNFPGRISPITKGNNLASPPLVVAFAIAGTMNIDLMTKPLGNDKEGNPVYLKDIWTSTEEINAAINNSVKPEMFIDRYKNIWEGTKEWQAVQTVESQTYDWDTASTYIASPAFFEGMKANSPEIKNITGATPLLVLGDSITTDHISPASKITDPESPAGRFLTENGTDPKDFNSYGSRRGHWGVMTRGTFANPTLENQMAEGKIGGFTKYVPTGEIMPIFDAAMKYKEENTPLVIIAGQNYGTGSSRDWAAKGTYLLGVKAVIAESYERIHRSNLVGMGVLPLQFKEGQREKLNLDGTETYDIHGIKEMCTSKGSSIPKELSVTINHKDGSSEDITVTNRIDTLDELEYFKHGGILQYTIRQLMKS